MQLQDDTSDKHTIIIKSSEYFKAYRKRRVKSIKRMVNVKLIHPNCEIIGLQANKRNK